MKLFDVGAELDANDAAANFDVSKDGKEFLMLRRSPHLAWSAEACLTAAIVCDVTHGI